MDDLFQTFLGGDHLEPEQGEGRDDPLSGLLGGLLGGGTGSGGDLLSSLLGGQEAAASGGQEQPSGLGGILGALFGGGVGATAGGAGTTVGAAGPASGGIGADPRLVPRAGLRTGGPRGQPPRNRSSRRLAWGFLGPRSTLARRVGRP